MAAARKRSKTGLGRRRGDGKGEFHCHELPVDRTLKKQKKISTITSQKISLRQREKEEGRKRKRKKKGECAEERENE